MVNESQNRKNVEIAYMTYTKKYTRYYIINNNNHINTFKTSTSHVTSSTIALHQCLLHWPKILFDNHIHFKDFISVNYYYILVYCNCQFSKRWLKIHWAASIPSTTMPLTIFGGRGMTIILDVIVPETKTEVSVELISNCIEVCYEEVDIEACVFNTNTMRYSWRWSAHRHWQICMASIYKYSIDKYSFLQHCFQLPA